MSEKLLFIDTETGGLDAVKHSLLSIGMVIWEEMEIVDSKEILINDGVLSVTREALSINRIDIEKHRQTALSSSQAVDELFAFTGKHFPGKGKITLAGHNVHFDAGFLKAFLAANNKDFSKYFSHRMIDTSSILHYLYLSGQIGQKAVSSDEAFAFFNIEVRGRHTALGDAIATAELFTKLLGLIKK
ncbi:MAG TPA: 3'-5' exonuclease [Bacteroidales bacterium]|nr:3'-5' exonuclease [Bacteroidales bacterium]